jgi:hypothetical protein
VKEEKNRDVKLEKPQGVIACLTAGFELTARSPQLLILPILLDLYLWLGPRLSVAPLVRELQAFWEAVPTAQMTAETYQALSQVLEEIADQFNLFVLLEPIPLLSVPSLMSQRLTVDCPWGARTIMEVPTFGVALGWIVGLLAAGMGLSALYFWLMGVRIRDAVEDLPIVGPQRPLKVWGQLLQFLVVVLALAFALSMPVILLTSVLTMVSIQLTGFLLTVLLSIVVFFALHCIYVLPGMIQFRKPPLRAVQESILLVRADFVGTLGMTLAILVINQGLNFIWTMPTPDQWLTLIGIGGHALVSTALIVALFIFYQERILYLRSLRQAYATGTLKTPVDT